jgi:hypothetical protein
MPEAEFDRLVRALAHLAAAWREYGDLEILAGLPDGSVTVDVVAGSARHGSAGPIPLRLAAELKAALEERLARKGIASGEIQAAELLLRIVHFDFELEARLWAAGKEYRALRREDHIWHDREPPFKGP